MADHLVSVQSKHSWHVCVQSQDLLGSRERVLGVVLDEAQAVADKHGVPRRSRILVSLPAV